MREGRKECLGNSTTLKGSSNFMLYANVIYASLWHSACCAEFLLESFFFICVAFIINWLPLGCNCLPGALAHLMPQLSRFQFLLVFHACISKSVFPDAKPIWNCQRVVHSCGPIIHCIHSCNSEWVPSDCFARTIRIRIRLEIPLMNKRSPLLLSRQLLISSSIKSRNH